MKNQQNGFTLIELLFVFGLIVVVAAVTTPVYLNHVKRQKFTEVIDATKEFKIGVERCATELGTLVGCSGGMNTVPANINAAGVPGAGKSMYTNKLVTKDGKITVTAEAGDSGLDGEVYAIQAEYYPETGVIWTMDAEASTCDDEKICM